MTDMALHRPDLWDDAVADYETFAEPLTAPLADQAIALAGGVAPGERVLDIACGTGALTLRLARQGAHVLAIDFSAGMVARTAARLEAEGLEDASAAREMDGQALALADASVESAWSLFGIFLFSDYRRGLAEMARVLQPGGRAVMSSWASRHGVGPAPLLMAALETCFPDRPPPPWPAGIVRLADPAALAEDIREAGLEDITLHPLLGHWRAPTADWVADSAHRLFRQMPGWAALNAGEQLLTADTLRTQLRARFPGEVVIPAPATIAIARKPG